MHILPFCNSCDSDVEPEDVNVEVENVDLEAAAADLGSESDLSHPEPSSSSSTVDDKSAIADDVAKYGSSSATAWLELDRYKIWQPSEPIPESTFLPTQGYMRKDPYVFAWGNPLVSDSVALLPTALAFTAWAKSQNLRPVWACVDHEFEEVLGETPLDWSVVHCIYEETIDPANVVELTSPDAVGKESGASVVKDLKKNLRRAEKEDVQVVEVRVGEWSEEDKRTVEQGIDEWKKARTGVQIASTALEPWIDAEHRRYWVARKAEKPVGLLILTPIHNHSWQIKNAISFPGSPRGTSETLIYTALSDLHQESQADDDAPEQQNGDTDDDFRVTMSFGITAREEMTPVQNLSGWKVTLLSSIYGKVARVAGLVKRGEFRKKFDSEHQPMYVCYPQDGFGLDGVNTMLKLLRK